MHSLYVEPCAGLADNTWSLAPPIFDGRHAAAAAKLCRSAADTTLVCLIQWCTTFFGHGPQISLLNPSGAKQVSQPNSDECLSKFKKMICTVNTWHNINNAFSGSE